MITPAHERQPHPPASRQPATYPEQGKQGLTVGDAPTVYGDVPLEDPAAAPTRPRWVAPALIGGALLLGFAIPYVVRSLRARREGPGFIIRDP